MNNRFLDSTNAFPSDTSDSVSATSSRSDCFSYFDEQCPIYMYSSTYQDVSNHLFNKLNELKTQTEETKQTFEQANTFNMFDF